MSQRERRQARRSSGKWIALFLGMAAALRAVFFARTVKGGGRDLAVLCRWETRGAATNGMSYGAEFYRLKENGSRIAVEPRD
jgi:hypothetical protein